MELSVKVHEPISATTQAVRIFNNPVFAVAVYIAGPTLAALVVMMLSQPKNGKQWVAMIISTVVCSLGLGAYVIKTHLGIINPQSSFDLMQIGAVFFVSGLPGWVLVRALFLYFESVSNKDILQILRDLKSIMK